MRSVHLILVLLPTLAFAQFPGVNGPWGQGVPPRPQAGKPPNRPSPFSRPVPNYGKPGIPPGQQIVSDDPIPPNPALDTSYEQQQLPSKLPLQAPNGVVEIYNRVVDDLIKKLEISFKKREIDPMNVIIRPTPASPVRVPGHLQKRPFRRPGAPLYRSNLPFTPVRMKNARSNPLPDEGTPLRSSSDQVEVEKPSFRGVGKISKGPLEDKADGSVDTTTPVMVDVTPASVSDVTVASTAKAPVSVVVTHGDKSLESSEEQHLFRARSEEYFPEDEEEEEEEVEPKESKSRSSISEKKTKKEQKKEESDEDEDEAKAIAEGKKDVDTLMQRYQNKNVNEVKEKGKTKYSAAGAKKKEDSSSKKKPEVSKNKAEEDELQEDDDDDEEIQDDLDDMGPQGGNNFYQGGGPLPQKPNAQLTGLSKIKRASDVTVNVDARSAIITARLLVGPLNVNINDSVEPMEKHVRATVPELEAELILMERHGVVFLQRFTLDRAYGQDVEISMPKSKVDAKKKKTPVQGLHGGQGPMGGPQGMDPNQAQQRFQTKMAAHISMEVVKLLRSGNLRVNMMRTAQSSMSKLKLPIKPNKNAKKKSSNKAEGKKN